MSIFDKLKSLATEKNDEYTFTFEALPESLEELKALPEASLDTPFKTAALVVCADCVFAADKDIGIAMLNFLKGPEPLSNIDISFLKDRFSDGKYYVPFSYFKGATPENDYTPDKPFTITVKANPYSFQNEGRATLWLTSGGADSPRQIDLRQKGNQWFMTQQMILAGIRDPKSKNPWA